jgi:flagellar hook-basal body complex protein FliE
MSIQAIGLRAYTNALQNFSQAEKKMQEAIAQPTAQANDFTKVLKDSLEKVNNLQSERSQMITSFASGETQNVHELMIAMQKASLAMNMTAAVRNKVMEAYKELTRMQF